MYIDAMKMQYSAYLTLLEAYKDEDYNLIAEANDKFKEASENLEDYYSEMRLLSKQYRVKYGEETERK